jgi:hypothetical protein
MRISLRELLTAVFMLAVVLAINVYVFTWARGSTSVEAAAIAPTLIAVDACTLGYFALEALVDST